MRRYEDVALINHPDPLARLCEALPRACPVAVELRPGSENLVDFVHPGGSPGEDPAGQVPSTSSVRRTARCPAPFSSGATASS